MANPPLMGPGMPKVKAISGATTPAMIVPAATVLTKVASYFVRSL